MASAQVSRYNATQRNKVEFHTVSLRGTYYDRVTEKARDMGYPRTYILEQLVKQFIDKVVLE